MTTRAIDYTYWEDLAKFIKGYLDCALWSSNNPETEKPLDDDYEVGDILTDWTRQAIIDCYEFMDANEDLLWATDEPDFGQHGYDFWLTRNHHGAGFWDRGYGESIGRQLTDASHAYGECDLFPSDMLPLDDEERDAALGHP
jgi:hypothetical protein